MRRTSLLGALALLCLPLSAWADAGVASPVDTAWLLTATALVLLMTLPGLALFYGGLVSSKNVLSVLMQCFAITALVSILWLLYGYSGAFGQGGALHAWYGGFGKLGLVGVDRAAVTGTLPESVFAMFQMTFAIITPALIVGGFAERMKFSAMLLFSALWLTLVYVPVCPWVWGGGWLAGLGLMDYAGGTVVHINAGVAALVAALVLGPRRGFPGTLMMPHNLTMTVTGAGMLWVGWYGFNAGSALAADGNAGMAMLVTHTGAAAGALTWMAIEWWRAWVRSRRPAAMSGLWGRWSSACWPAAFVLSQPNTSSGFCISMTAWTCFRCTAWAASSARCWWACSRPPGWGASVSAPVEWAGSWVCRHSAWW